MNFRNVYNNLLVIPSALIIDFTYNDLFWNSNYSDLLNYYSEHAKPIMQQSKFPVFLIDIIFSHRSKQITVNKTFKKKMVLNNKIT